jgi:hypothetical protein
VRWVWSVRAREAGQGTPEYAGVLGVVALVVAALVLTTPGVGATVSGGIRRAVCLIVAEGGCGDTATAAPGAEVGADAGPGDAVQAERDFDAEALLQGFIAGAWNEITGFIDLFKSLWSFVSDSEYRRQLGEVVQAFMDDPMGFARQILAALWEPIQAALDGGETEYAVGLGLAAVVFAVIGGKGLNRLGELSRMIETMPREFDFRAHDWEQEGGRDDHDPGVPYALEGGLSNVGPGTRFSNARTIENMAPGMELRGAFNVQTRDFVAAPARDEDAAAALNEVSFGQTSYNFGFRMRLQSDESLLVDWGSPLNAGFADNMVPAYARSIILQEIELATGRIARSH